MILETIVNTVFVMVALTLTCMCCSSALGEEDLDMRGADLDQLKVCRFRQSVLPVEAFPLYSGFNCLNYNDYRVFVGDENPAATTCTLHVLDMNVSYPCYQRGNDTLPFNPMDTEAFNELSVKFKKSSDAQRWQRCYQASLQCCNKIVTTYGAQQDASRCPQLWDGWDCWESTAEDTFQTSYCKEYIYSADAAPSCHYPSRKHCFSRASTNTSRAQWNQTTDYSGCSTKSRLLVKYTFHLAMLGVSIALSSPAVVIFFCYRRLRIPRIALHRNLLIVIIVRSALTMVQIGALSFNSLLATDELSVMDENGVGCRLLSALVQLLSNSVFAMMLVEGIFLHRLIAAVFRSEPNMIYLYTAAVVIAVLPMIPWTVLRLVKYDYSCWATGAADLDWINNGTRVALLAINFLLMLDIIRVLLTKLRGVNSWHSDKIKRTARSTLFLLPLFGVNTLFVADKPSVIPSCDWENAFDMVTHAMEGLQGPCVALLYCYLNKEVKMYLWKTVSDTFPRLEAMRSRVSTQFARRTFTTNVGDDDGGRCDPARSSVVDAAACRNPLSQGADATGRRSVPALAPIGEAKLSAEDPLVGEKEHRGRIFDAWNKFRDPTKNVACWNITPSAGDGGERRGQATKDSTTIGRSGSVYTQELCDSHATENSSTNTSRSSGNSAEHREGGTKLNSTADTERNSDNVESTSEITSAPRSSRIVRNLRGDNSNLYAALVFPPSSNTVQGHRDRICNMVVQVQGA